MEKISYDEYLGFLYRYWTYPEYKFLRLGQVFLSDFFPEATDPLLFYSNCNTKTNEMILEKYVEMGFDEDL